MLWRRGFQTIPGLDIIDTEPSEEPQANIKPCSGGAQQIEFTRKDFLLLLFNLQNLFVYLAHVNKALD